MSDPDRYRLVIAPAARRQLADALPEAVAFAAHEFIVGPLLDKPRRVGKPLHEPLDDRHSARRGTYRVIYRIDEQVGTVTVLTIMQPWSARGTTTDRFERPAAATPMKRQCGNDSADRVSPDRASLHDGRAEAAPTTRPTWSRALVP